MKKIYILSGFFLALCFGKVSAQPEIYALSVNHIQVNLRGGAVILGTLHTNLPADGYVVVHFDGECYASVGDRIVLAASNTGEWSVNDGNVAIETSLPGFGRPFSHTRVYQVTAGEHDYYAVGQNFAETDGSGKATIHGTLSVEYFPDTGLSKVKSTGIIFNGDVANTTVVEQLTLHATGAGKMVVRFDGFITSDAGDRVVLAASNTMNWSFNDGNVSVEAVNEGDVDENSFSHTRVYNVNSAGDFTYYALAQVYGKTAGNHMIWVYGNLVVEFFPSSGSEKILSDGFTLPTIDLNGQSTTLTSVLLNAPVSGKVMVVLDGYLTANKGYDIVLAASNNGEWTENDGHITLQALNDDQNRYSFSHTRVYNVSAGNQTFYAVGEIFGGSGSKTADLFGHLTVKYIPSSSTALDDKLATPNDFELYPNPTDDVVHVAFNYPTVNDINLRVLDIYGRMLGEYQQRVGKEMEMRLDLSNYPAGLYWISIGNSLKPVVKK